VKGKNKPMKKASSVLILLSLVVLLTTILLSACGQAAATPTASPTLDGKTLLQERCSVCHSADRIASLRGTTSEWTNLVDNMVSRGAQLNSTERQTLIDYLAQNK
jgi:cytochrome c5